MRRVVGWGPSDEGVDRDARRLFRLLQRHLGRHDARRPGRRGSRSAGDPGGRRRARPAVLLGGIPVAESTADMEQTTPTGAAILATVAESFGPLPPMTIDAIGKGAGTRELPDLANILRLFVGRVAASARGDRIWILET